MTEKKEKKEEKKIDTEELKKEASTTVNKVKDTIKKTDIKKDSVETKSFIVEMFKDPIGKLNDISKDKTGKYFKYAIIIVVIWAFAKLISSCFSVGSYWNWYNIISTMISTVLDTISPVIAILVMSLIVFAVNKNNKKPLTTVISAVTAASIPTVIASVVSLLNIISSSAYIITGPFTSLCGAISIVLTYFALKDLFDEEKNANFIKKFVIIEALYYVAYIVLSLLKIYI